jgi:hypothetical protein
MCHIHIHIDSKLDNNVANVKRHTIGRDRTFASWGAWGLLNCESTINSCMDAVGTEWLIACIAWKARFRLIRVRWTL